MTFNDAHMYECETELVSNHHRAWRYSVIPGPAVRSECFQLLWNLQPSLGFKGNAQLKPHLRARRLGRGKKREEGSPRSSSVSELEEARR